MREWIHPGREEETGGSQCSQVKKSRMSSDPSTNSGRATIANDAVEMPWSSGRPARTAERTPRSSDSGIIRIVTRPARISEFAILSWIWPQIVSFPPAAYPAAELPRSPLHAGHPATRRSVQRPAC